MEVECSPASAQITAEKSFHFPIFNVRTRVARWGLLRTVLKNFQSIMSGCLAPLQVQFAHIRRTRLCIIQADGQRRQDYFDIRIIAYSQI